MTASDVSRLTWAEIKIRIQMTLKAKGFGQDDMESIDLILDQASSMSELIRIYEERAATASPWFERFELTHAERDSAFHEGTLKVKKAIQHEGKWGGLLFDGQGIAKALSELGAKGLTFFPALEEAVAGLGPLLLCHDAVKPLRNAVPEMAETFDRMDKSIERMLSINARASQCGAWMQQFNHALLTIGRLGPPRALMAVAPPEGWPSE